MKWTREAKIIQSLLWVTVLTNIVFWFCVRDVQSRWTNVPPAPDLKYASAIGLGDRSLSYRINGIMIQNMGDTGGRSTSLNDYNYESLKKWFFLQDSLDQHSDFTPYLAGYYFGSVQTPEKFRPILDYLENIGIRTHDEKWRWLAQAIFLARFRMKDMDKALELAYTLSAVKNPEMPEWARHMPAFIMNAKGEKDAAYALLVEILKTRGDKLHPEEVNAMRAYICEQILEPDKAKINPLCKKTP